MNVRPVVRNTILMLNHCVIFFQLFVTAIWYNSNRRLKISVLSDHVTREPLASEWITTDMAPDEVLRQLGDCKARNIILGAQSGHSGLTTEQRPGEPYDFRHKILIHITHV